jgi:hypothetical protein
MNFDLAAMIRTRKVRRKSVTFRPIEPTASRAADLYAACYRPTIDLLTAAIPQILASYERSLPVRDSIRDAASDNEGILASLGAALSRLVLDLTPNLRSWTLRSEKTHRTKWQGAVLTASGIDISTILAASGQPQSVGDTIAWNVALMRDVGTKAQAQISSAVYAAFTARQPVADLARDIRDIVGMTRRRALGIAADQSSKLSAALDRERRDQAGIVEFRYRHSFKRHPRPWHAARDGKIYNSATGQQVDGPDVIAPDDRPGIPPWCGCREMAHIDLS